MNRPFVLSLCLGLSIFTGATTALGRNPAKPGVGGQTTTVSVVTGECGDSGVTSKYVSSGGQFVVMATSDQLPNNTSGNGYAGTAAGALQAGGSVTNLQSILPIPQGTYTETATLSGPATLYAAVGYSWTDPVKGTEYGASFLPYASTSTNSNQSLKGKNTQVSITVNTNLLQQFNLGNLATGYIYTNTKAPPVAGSTNFQLLGVGTAIANSNPNLGLATATFNNFQINGTPLMKNTVLNLNGNQIRQMVASAATFVRTIAWTVVSTVKSQNVMLGLLIDLFQKLRF